MKGLSFPEKIVIYLVLILVSVLFLSPFVWSLFTSLKPTREIYSIPITIMPHQPTLEHYQYVFENMPSFVVYFRNSVVVSSISVGLVLLFSAMGGYALGRFTFKGSNVFLFVILLVLALPWGMFLIPIYIMEDTYGLIDTLPGLILPYTALNLPLATMIMRGTFRSMPSELEDSSRIDGCSIIQTWYLVMLPIARGGVAAAGIFTFIMAWGEFMYARTLMLTTETRTLAVGITELKIEGGSWAYGPLAATIMLSVVPALILFLIMQRHFARALTEGAFKA